MRLYDIDAAIAELLDEETGEIIDFEAFENLNIEREKKIEYLCKSIKEAPLLADALQSEIARLQEKKKSILNSAERKKAFLQGYLGGEKYKSPLFTCYYGSTKEVKGDEEEFMKWAIENNEDDYLKYKDPELKTSAIKAALAEGKKLPYLEIVDRKYLCIK